MRCLALSCLCALSIALSLPLACADTAASVSLLPAPADMPFFDSLEEGDDFAAGWMQPPLSPRILCAWEQGIAGDGYSSIRLQKRAYDLTPPYATCWRTLKYDGKSPGIKVTLKVRAIEVIKASIDVQFCDADDNWTARRAANVGIKISGDPAITHHWQEYSGSVEVPPGTDRIAVAVTLVSAGTLWFDDVRVEYTDEFPKGEFLANVETSGLVFKDGFEAGLDAPYNWAPGPELRGVKYLWDKEISFEGSACVALEKRFAQAQPGACWSRTFEHSGSSDILEIVVRMKAEKLVKAAVDVVFRDENGAEIRQNLFVVEKQKSAENPVTHDWKRFPTQVKIPDGAATVTIELQILGKGKVYFDGLSVRYLR